MTTKRTRGRLFGALSVFSLLLGITLVSSVKAQAQQYPYGQDDRYGRDRDDGYRRRNDGYNGNRGNNVYQAAAERGYQDGLYTGREDSYRGQSYDPERSHFFKNATYGYNSSYGNKNAYKQAYRDGFLRGYREGYRGNGRNGRGPYNRGGILGGIFGRP
jgi:hypothetical protein